MQFKFGSSQPLVDLDVVDTTVTTMSFGPCGVFAPSPRRQSKRKGRSEGIAFFFSAKRIALRSLPLSIALAGIALQSGRPCLTSSTYEALVCECEHQGRIRCRENDAPFSSPWEEYSLEVSIGLQI